MNMVYRATLTNCEIDTYRFPVEATVIDDSAIDDEPVEIEPHILEQLEKGNKWAWCVGVVSVHFKGLSASEYLDRCSYPSQQAFREADVCKSMVARCIDRLNAMLSLVILSTED
jgi:hypothetical protein